MSDAIAPGAGPILAPPIMLVGTNFAPPQNPIASDAYVSHYWNLLEIFGELS